MRDLCSIVRTKMWNANEFRVKVNLETTLSFLSRHCDHDFQYDYTTTYSYYDEDSGDETYEDMDMYSCVYCGTEQF